MGQLLHHQRSTAAAAVACFCCLGGEVLEKIAKLLPAVALFPLLEVGLPWLEARGGCLNRLAIVAFEELQQRCRVKAFGATVLLTAGLGEERMWDGERGR